MQLKNNRQSEAGTGKGPETSVPQNILDCVRSALSPYITSWDKVQDAIMSSGTEDQQADTEEETFLSTEDVSKMFHVSRTTLHRDNGPEKEHGGCSIGWSLFHRWG